MHAIGTDAKITKLTSFLHVGGPEKDHFRFDDHT